MVEDFTGENYLVAKGKIEAQCQCNVIVEYEKVKEEDKIKEDTVIKQNHQLVNQVNTVVKLRFSYHK